MKPNVVLLVLDALPAKKCYDSGLNSKTPNIVKLMKNGVSFKQAISSGNETMVSFATMFTGLFPFAAAIRPTLMSYKYKPNIENYIRILKKNGYNTYATLPELTAWKEVFSDFEIDYYQYHDHRLFNGLGEKIVKNLNDKQMKEPWFYLIHLMDSHKPINYPDHFNSNEFGLDEYERMMAFVDSWIGKFLENLNLEKTLVILTADHGDYIRTIIHNGKRISFEYRSFAKSTHKVFKLTPKFLYPIMIKSLLALRNFITKIKLLRLGVKLTPYESRTLTSARSFTNHFLYDEVIHVPLIMTGFGIPKGKKIQNLVGLVDLFPTICDILGIKEKPKFQHGRSLLPLLEGREFKEFPIYSETSLNLKNENEGGYGIRTSKYKYFRTGSKKDKKINLYDLEKDPLEEVNLSEDHKDIIQHMEGLLKELKNNVPQESETDFIKKQIAKMRKNLLFD